MSVTTTHYLAVKSQRICGQYNPETNKYALYLNGYLVKTYVEWQELNNAVNRQVKIALGWTEV